MDTRMSGCARLVACSGIALLLAACGGGGGYGGGGGGGAASYTVGGSVSGLAAGDTLVLQDNGTNPVTITANGSFTFSTPLNFGMPYTVSVRTQPATPVQTCTVTNGSGTIGYANVTNVTVTCV